MHTLTVYKILKDYDYEAKGHEPEALYGFSKEDLFERVFDHINEMNPAELSSVPDNIEVTEIETYPERDIPDFYKHNGQFVKHNLILGTNIYEYSLVLNKWILSPFQL